MKFSVLTYYLIAGLTIVCAAEPKPDLRVIPAYKDALMCLFTNTIMEVVNFSPEFLGNDNFFSSVLLSDPKRLFRPLGPVVTYYQKPALSQLPPSETYSRTVSGWELSHLFGHIYYKLRWHLDERISMPVFFGYASQSKPLFPPVVSDKCTNVEAILAYVYNKDVPENSELGFLLFNGTNISITVMQPLFNDSRLIVTAPSINYSNEVFTVSNTATNAVVEPRAVAEWRIPWQSTYQQLPAPDRAQLEAAGNVDLYWKCGNYVSPVLPLFLKP